MNESKKKKGKEKKMVNIFITTRQFEFQLVGFIEKNIQEEFYYDDHGIIQVITEGYTIIHIQQSSPHGFAF